MAVNQLKAVTRTFQQCIAIGCFHIYLESVITRNGFPNAVYSGIYGCCIQFGCLALNE
ncbi:hypothetical protein D3C81_1675100 [compost metagenome]